METQVQAQVNEGENAPAAPQAPLTGKRANWTIAHKIDDAGRQIIFSVKGAGTLTLAMDKVSAENQKRAALHGMVQRVSDAAAMARDSKTGASATPQQKYEAMRRLVEHYVSGSAEWSPVRSTEGVGRPRVDREKELLSMALGIHSKDKSAETIAKFVQGLTKPQVTALLLSAQLREAVELAREELRKEEEKLVAGAGVNAEELLSGL